MNYDLIKTPSGFKDDRFDMNETEVLEYFSWFLGLIPKRTQVFSSYLLCQDVEWDNKYTKSNLSILDNVFPGLITKEKMSADDIIKMESGIKGNLSDVDILPNKKLSDFSVSICFDIGIYFGEYLKMEHDLNWEPCLGSKKNMNYGLPILTKQKKTIELNPRLIIENLAYKAIDNEYRKGQLIALLSTWGKLFSS